MRCLECRNNTSITGPDGRCLECLQDEWSRRDHIESALTRVVAVLVVWFLAYVLVLFLFVL
jgi:hypothetical protein